jgi:hypothetical protein
MGMRGTVVETHEAYLDKMLKKKPIKKEATPHNTDNRIFNR